MVNFFTTRTSINEDHGLWKLKKINNGLNKKSQRDKDMEIMEEDRVTNNRL